MMPSPPAPLSILVLGCGVAGPALASFLLTHSDIPTAQTPSITICERASDGSGGFPKAKGQNIDVRGAGVTVARKLGIEKAIRASVTGEEGNRFVDTNNVTWGEGAADKSGRIQTGTSDIEILRGTLAKLLYERSKELSDEVKTQGGQGIEYIFGDYADTIEQDGDSLHVHFAKSGKQRTYDIVVGADGLQSTTRRLIWGEAGEKDRVHRLGMYGGFFSLPATSTDSLWRRWYHAPGRRSVMLRPHERRDMSTIFMSIIPTTPTEQERFAEVAVDGRKGIPAQKVLLKEYFQHAGWECERVVGEMMKADDFYYDMVAQVKMDQWHKGRVVLLGDAGYCASPISGMGTTLALTGAYNLAGAIVQHCILPERPTDPSAAFTQYREAMLPIVTKAQKLVPGAPHIMLPETAWGVAVAHWIFYAIWCLRVQELFAMFAGPPANAVPVQEYGFKTLPEWEGWERVVK